MMVWARHLQSMGVGLGGRGLSGSLPTDCKCLSQDPLSLPEGPKLPVVTRCGQLKTCPHPLPPPCSPTAPAQGVAFQACHSHQKTYQKPPLLLKQVRVLWKSAFKNSVCVVFLKNTCCAFSSLIFCSSHINSAWPPQFLSMISLASLLCSKTLKL